MSNSSSPLSNVCRTDPFVPWWLTGIGTSVLCLIAQVLVVILMPKCRQYEAFVLIQLSLARLVNTVDEYSIVIGLTESLSPVLKDAVLVTYVQTDLTMVCWMFVFSKNLYDKVVVVFNERHINLFLTSAVIWLCCLPVGFLFLHFTKYDNVNYIKLYNSYSVMKFLIIMLNMLLFIRIFSVVFKRGLNRMREFRHFVKSAIIFFCLVCMTSLHVFITDLLSIFFGQNRMAVYTFCVVNSFHIFLVTVIFIVLQKEKIRETLSTEPIKLDGMDGKMDVLNKLDDTKHSQAHELCTRPSITSN